MRSDEPTRPLPRRRVLLLGAAAGCACAASPAVPVDRPPVSDEPEVQFAPSDVDARLDAQAQDAIDAAAHLDRSMSNDLPTDRPYPDRGAPCELEFPFVPSLFLDEVPAVGAVVDYELYVVIARDRAGLYAYTAICPHQRCVVALEETGSRCPCHDSSFDIEGRVLSGPSTRSLVNHPVRVCGGRIWVDRTHPVSLGTRVTP